VNSRSYDLDLLNDWSTPQIRESGFWNESREMQSKEHANFSHVVKAVGLGLLMAFSPITAISDPWLSDRRRRDSVITVSVYQEIIGRYISRSDALRISSQILEQAEAERLAIAEFEATRGLHWED
jgi:hypothetical protein